VARYRACQHATERQCLAQPGLAVSTCCGNVKCYHSAPQQVRFCARAMPFGMCLTAPGVFCGRTFLLSESWPLPTVIFRFIILKVFTLKRRKQYSIL